MKFHKIVSAFALLTMVGCKGVFEDNDTTLDGSAPANNITSPAANNVYQASQPVNLVSELLDKDGFEEVDVKIVRLASDSKGSASVISFKKKPKQNAFKLDTTFAANTFTSGKYQIVMRSVDSRKNEGTKEVLFSVQ